MALPLHLVQDRQLREQVAMRAVQASDLKEVHHILGKAVADMTRANEHAEGLINRLIPKDSSKNEPAGADPVKIVSAWVAFAAEVQKAESIAKMYSKTVALNRTARKIESQSAALDKEIELLKETKSRMAQLLEAKKATIELTKIARKSVEDALKV